MNAVKKQRLIEDFWWTNVVLGLWLILSPFVLRFDQIQAATWNSIVVGIAIMGFSLARTTGTFKNSRIDWVSLCLGIWLVISAFVLGFSNELRAVWNNVILGLVIGIAALSDALRRPVSSINA